MFSTHEQKFLFWWYTLHKICMIPTFRWADSVLLRKWLTTDIWNKK